MIDFKMMQDASEIVSYDKPGIPLYIREGFLSDYPHYSALMHWHPDIELIYIISGSMEYDISGEHIVLHENDLLFVNSENMHYGFSSQKKECHFLCVLFDPDLLRSNSTIFETYVNPVIKDKSVTHMIFSKNNILNQSIRKLFECKISETGAYELTCTGILFEMWKEFSDAYSSITITNTSTPDNVAEIQKKMVSFIYKNYAEDLTIEKIAKSANISRSTCCLIFKKYIKTTPIDFLNQYRMELVKRLLVNSDYSVTDIATSCGFNHMSYFSKQFKKETGQTPTAYRKANR